MYLAQGQGNTLTQGDPLYRLSLLLMWEGAVVGLYERMLCLCCSLRHALEELAFPKDPALLLDGSGVPIPTEKMSYSFSEIPPTKHLALGTEGTPKE